LAQAIWVGALYCLSQFVRAPISLGIDTAMPEHDSLLRTISGASLEEEKLIRARSLPQCRSLRLHAPVSACLMTPEVSNFQPPRAEFWSKPETDAEALGLRKLRDALRAERDPPEGTALEEDDECSNDDTARLLRTLRYNNGEVASSVETLRRAAEGRAQHMPLDDTSLMNDLRSGFLYLHGRDRECRPCIVIRVERMVDGLSEDVGRLVRLVMFVLEFAEKFALVPGRVEHWVVIFDLASAGNLLSESWLSAPFEIANMISVAMQIAAVLEPMFAGRLAWLKIVNLPVHGALQSAVSMAIPAEKRDMVSFVQDAASELARHFEPRQLEARYGGSALDVEPEQVYPFRFFESSPEVPDIVHSDSASDNASDANAYDPWGYGW